MNQETEEHFMQDALLRLLSLAYDGCTVTLERSLVGDGVALTIDMGALRSRQVIATHDLNLAKVEPDMVASYVLDRIERDVAELLEREITDDPDR